MCLCWCEFWYTSWPRQKVPKLPGIQPTKCSPPRRPRKADSDSLIPQGAVCFPLGLNFLEQLIRALWDTLFKQSSLQGPYSLSTFITFIGTSRLQNHTVVLVVWVWCCWVVSSFFVIGIRSDLIPESQRSLSLIASRHSKLWKFEVLRTVAFFSLVQLRRLHLFGQL